MNMILTPGQLMRSLCQGWVKAHPEDADLPTLSVLRKLLRSYAMAGGSSMVLMTAGTTIQHFALVEYNHFNG